jgi:hypothetical protein
MKGNVINLSKTNLPLEIARRSARGRISPDICRSQQAFKEWQSVPFQSSASGLISRESQRK